MPSIFSRFFGKKGKLDKQSALQFSFEKKSISAIQLKQCCSAMLSFINESERDLEDNVNFEHSLSLYKSYLEYTQSLQAFFIKAIYKDEQEILFDDLEQFCAPEQIKAVQKLQELKALDAIFIDDVTHEIVIPDVILAVGIPYTLWPVLGLPPMGAESIYMSHEGSPYLKNFSIWYSLFSEKRRIIKPVREGIFLKTSGGLKHLLSPETYIVAETIDQYKKEVASENADHKLAWARASAVLNLCFCVKQDISVISHSKLLVGYKVTAELSRDGNIRPVIIRPDSSDDDFTPLLLKKEKEAFAKFLDSNLSLSGHVQIGDNTFLFIPPDVRAVVDAIRNVNKGDPKNRLSFIANPSKFLAAALEQSDIELSSIDEVISKTFVETPEFLSERVNALGPWQKETCSFGRTAATNWFQDTDERVGIMLNGQYEWLTKEELENLICKAQQASDEEVDSIEFNGEEIPADSISLDELKKCLQTVFTDSADESLDDAKLADTDGRFTGRSNKSSAVLNDDELREGADSEPNKFIYGPDIKRNLHTLEYKSRLQKRDLWDHELSTLSSGLCLLPHQIECLNWLKGLWNMGCPGALLADDMGLGKTIECLSFLAWIAQAKSKNDSNVTSLIIAPAGLISNWEEEGKKWIGENFGQALRLDGTSVRSLKKLPLSERFERLESQVWAVTSYDTLRFHQDFFLQYKWGLVVLDEAQKIKTPNTLQTECTKALKSDFLLAMTGTPVENSFLDLWSIMDAAVPGVMGSAKEFAGIWSDNERIEESGRELRNLLEGLNPDQKIRLMMRRLKTERLKELPKKEEIVQYAVMPKVQAVAYKNALSERDAVCSEKGGSLALLARLASISLLPRRLSADDVISDEDIRSSAKLTAFFNILDDIVLKHEKALIFISHLRIQSALSLKIYERYHMDHIPAVINGSRNSDVRQMVVKKFQDEKRNNEFDCVVLTNRAAATGLTLTAANHVIHLERWWNPAVEDQCSARCWRIGQHKNVVIHIPVPVFPNRKIKTFDEVLQKFLETKRLRSESVLMPQQSYEAAANELFDGILNSSDSGEDAV